MSEARRRARSQLELAGFQVRDDGHWLAGWVMCPACGEPVGARKAHERSDKKTMKALSEQLEERLAEHLDGH